MQENHSVTVDPTQQSLPVSRINQTKFYLKAGAVLLATTAVYAVARATRLFPQWQSSDANDVAAPEIENIQRISALVDLSHMKVNLVEKKGEIFQEVNIGNLDHQPIQSVSERRLTDFQEVGLVFPEQNSQAEQKTNLLVKSDPHKRKLLGISATPVVVVNPISDQIIQIGDQYTYDLNRVFSGDYLMITATETGKSDLPSWLKLQYKQVNSYPGSAPVSNAITMFGDMLFTMSSAGLQILEVTDILNPRLLSTAQGLTGQCILVSENILFATDYAGLKVIDISEINNPRLLGSCYYSSNTATGIVLSGNTLFSADWTSGLHIVNVSDRESPKLSLIYTNGTSSNSGFCAITGSGNILFAAYFNLTGNIYCAVQMFNMDNPTTPILLNAYPVACGGVYNLAIFNSTTLIIAADKLTILDISDPFHPYKLADYSSEGCGGFAQNGMAISGNMVFLPCVGLKIIDISDLLNIKSIGYYFPQNAIGISGVFVSGDIVCVGGEVSPIAYLKQISMIGTPLNSEVIVGQQFSISVNAWDANGIILATNTFTLTLNNLPRLVQSTLTDQSIFPDQLFSLPINSGKIFDNPSSSLLQLSLSLANGNALPAWLKLQVSPTLLKTYPNFGYRNYIRVKNVLLGLGCNVLQVVEVGEPASPNFLPQIYTPGCVEEATIDQDLLFGSGWNSGLSIINISDPMNPQFIGNYLTIAYPNSISIAGNAVLIAESSPYDLAIIDVSNLRSPQFLLPYKDSDSDVYNSVVVSGNIAFIATGNEGLKIINMSNPLSPQCIYRDTNDLLLLSCNFITIYKNTVFLSNNNQGFEIIDVSDPIHPKLLNHYPSNGFNVFTNKIIISGDMLFLCQFSYGTQSDLQIFDISNATSPSLLGKYPAVNCIEVKVLKDIVYVSDNSGLNIVDFRTWQLTANPTTSDEGNYHLKLTATDIIGSSVSKAFTIRVEGPPRVHAPIPAQYAKVGQSFYLASAGTFTDPNFDPLVFTLAPINSTALPAWLNFDPVTVTFSGTPAIFDMGTVAMQLTATDPLGGTASNTFNITVTRPPKVANIPQPLTLIQGVPFTYIIPSNIFNSYDGMPLSYGLVNGDGSPLPLEFSFISGNLTFSGTPVNVGITNLLLTARDSSNGELSTPISLLIHASLPVLPSQYAKVSQAFNYYAAISDGLNNPRFNPLIFSASRVDQTALPTWLNFNPGALTFTGTPAGADVGTLTVCLTAQDSLGNRGQQRFNITIIYPPESVNPLQPLTLIQGVAFHYTVPSNAFDNHGQSLSYAFSNGDGSLLSSEFSFTPNTTTLSGVPQSIGITNLLFTAEDTLGDTLSSTLDILVHASLPTIPNQYAKVSQAFNYYASLSDGLNNPRFNPLVFAASRADQTAFPSWLNFNPGTLTFTGTPAGVDVGTLTVRLTARDSLGNLAEQRFNITVIYPPELVNPLQPLTLIQGVAFRYTVPSNTFNSYGQALSYTFSNGDGSSLSSEFSFISNTITLSGIPQNVGITNLLFTAQDTLGDTLSSNLDILVHASLPTIPNQYAKVSELFNYYASLSDGLNNIRFSPLIFSALRADQTALPGWLSFNPGTSTFVGTPSSSEVGIISLRLIATDSLGNSAHTDFNLTVLYAPVVNSPITQAVNLVAGRSFSFSIPKGTFYDYGQALTYALKNADGSGFIPPWIQFNPNNGTLFGTPSNLGPVTLFIIAEDAAHNQASTPLSLIISANAPPQVVQPISTQTAQAGQLFNFFVPANTFADPNGDPLTYSASLLGGSAFPDWLSFDPKTVSFKGMPSGTDTDAFSARILTIVLVASDPERASANTLFNLNVGGTSDTVLALKIGAPVVSVLGALFGLYRNRAHIINRVRYPKYQRPEQEIRVGESFILQLSTPRHLVGSVKAKTRHIPPKGCGRFIDGQRFFKKPIHYLQLPFDKLPGGESLPSWMEYDEDSNILCSKEPVPHTYYRELNIRVKDKNGKVTEQFSLRIEGATLATLAEEREKKPLSTLPTQACLQEEQNQSAIEMSELRGTTEEPASPAACV